MASVFVKDGRLVLQLRIRGLQLREALHLRDTAANRKWAEGECILIERELVTGTFDYWNHFPQSRSAKAKAMFPRLDRRKDLTVEAWVRRWFELVKPRWVRLWRMMWKRWSIAISCQRLVLVSYET